MVDKPASPDGKATAPEGAPTPPVPPKRGPGHRGAEVKDTVAEMAAKAHEISLEAGSRMAAAMKDVINAAAGLTGFVLESARDLVQYMVRRGQMTQEEADKLIRQAEEAHAGRKATHPQPSTPAQHPTATKATPATPSMEEEGKDDQDEKEAAKKGEKKPAAKTADKSAEKGVAAKGHEKEPEKPAAKKAATKTATAKKATTKRK